MKIFLIYELLYLLLLVGYFSYEYYVKGTGKKWSHFNLIDNLDDEYNCVPIIMLLLFGMLAWPFYIITAIVIGIAYNVIKYIKSLLDDLIAKENNK